LAARTVRVILKREVQPFQDLCRDNMYPKVKRVRRGDQTYEYLELVEGHRVDGQVRQRVVATLGRLDELKASGRLEHLVAGLARTAVRFTGTYLGSELVAKGWAADRSIGRQVKTLQASTPTGVPVYLRPYPGSTSELPAFMQAIDTLAGQLPPGLVVVADSGL